VQVFAVHHGRKPVAQESKIVLGQHDLALLHVLELQATAHV
jgi:hypothetical protein